MKKICPRYKATLIASNKPYQAEDILCDQDKCQYWRFCSELDTFYDDKKWQTYVPQDEEDPDWAGARHCPELENESKTVSFEVKDVPE